ncbi:hypothetical protein L0Z65_01660 [Phaeobacter sp. BS52]|uniref:hypothetical protein n=1 Tax=Phaeobacter sp. BS52 TaxID=2907241 RepID=UPI003865BE84
MMAKFKSGAAGMSGVREFILFVWNEQKVVGAIVSAAVAVVALFAFNFFSELMFFSDPGNLNRPVEPWMSMRLVAQSWGVPKENMIEALGYPDDTPIDELPRKVSEYLGERGLTIAEFQALIEQTQAKLRGGMWQ